MKNKNNKNYGYGANMHTLRPNRASVGKGQYKMTAEDTEINAGLGIEQATVEAETQKTDSKPGGVDKQVVGGLDENVAGALAYLFGFITGLIFLLTEEDNEFVRFHAAQSTILFGSMFILSIALGIGQIFAGQIPAVGWLLSLVLSMGSLLIGPVAFVLWVVLLIKAYSGQYYSLPIAGKIAEDWI